MNNILPININKKLEENIQYRSVGCSIIPYTIFYNKNKHNFMPLHFHKEYQISWVYEGELKFIIEGKEVNLNKNNIVLINSGVLHSSTTTNVNARTLCINFDLSFLDNAIFKKYIIPYFDSDIFSYEVLDVNPVINEYLHGILKNIDTSDNEINEAKGSEFIIPVVLIQVLLEKIISQSEPLIEKEDTEEIIILTNLLSYIHENYHSKIQLEELQKIGHIGKTRCNDIFRYYTKMSPIQYIKQYRLKKAQELILKTDKNISIIADECGFSNVSYFVEQFRKQYAIAPLKYRNIYK